METNMAAETKPVISSKPTDPPVIDRKKNALAGSTKIELKHALETLRLKQLADCTEDEIEAELTTRIGANDH
jgi:hypothetical protein